MKWARELGWSDEGERERSKKKTYRKYEKLNFRTHVNGRGCGGRVNIGEEEEGGGGSKASARSRLGSRTYPIRK
jgi:hypothetical protein